MKWVTLGCGCALLRATRHCGLTANKHKAWIDFIYYTKTVKLVLFIESICLMLLGLYYYELNCLLGVIGIPREPFKREIAYLVRQLGRLKEQAGCSEHNNSSAQKESLAPSIE